MISSRGINISFDPVVRNVPHCNLKFDRCPNFAPVFKGQYDYPVSIPIGTIRFGQANSRKRTALDLLANTHYSRHLLSEDQLFASQNAALHLFCPQNLCPVSGQPTSELQTESHAHD